MVHNSCNAWELAKGRGPRELLQPPNTRETVAANYLFHPRPTPLRRLSKHDTTGRQEMGHDINLWLQSVDSPKEGYLGILSAWPSTEHQNTLDRSLAVNPGA